jgi:hypothetical protein
VIDETAIAATAASVVRIVREVGPVLIDWDLVELALNEVDWGSMIPVRRDGRVDRARVVAILLGFADSQPLDQIDLAPVEELT